MAALFTQDTQIQALQVEEVLCNFAVARGNGARFLDVLETTRVLFDFEAELSCEVEDICLVFDRVEGSGLGLAQL